MTPILSAHHRVQWSVGQGGFHSARLDGSHKSFNYVYDCGSSTKSAIRPAVASFLKSLGNEDHIDAVFLSHIDQDHVNGLPTLLGGGVPVDRIFLPLLTPLERLAAAAQPARAVNSFGADLASDPVSAIHRLNPNIDVVAVRPSAEPADAGDGEALDIGPISRAPSPFEIVGQPGDWRPVGQHQVEMSSHAIFRLDRGTAASPWLISLYIAQESLDRLQAFQLNLSKRLGQDPSTIASWLTPERIACLLTDPKGLTLVRGALADSEVNPNHSSMSMLSGPAADDTSEYFHLGSRLTTMTDESASWLFTGDAHLSSAAAVEALAAHFGHRAQRVSVIALPHHGSQDDFHRSLLDLGIPPLFTYASAGLSHHHWRHPASAVVKEVASAGTFVWTVTEHKKSKISASAYPTSPFGGH